jgi:hypothetical protein
MTQPTTPVITAELQNWLKGQCNRYANGQCMTRRCLIRGGGYKDGDPTAKLEKASCEPHEILLALGLGTQ